MTEKKVSTRGRVGEGRPSQYKPGYCDLLIEHMKDGNSYETFAVMIPDKTVTERTLYNWEKVHPEFFQAKRRGFLLSKKHWEDLGKVIINGEVKGSTTGWIFTMKCRFGYVDSQIDLSNMPTEQLKELAKKALEKIEEIEGKE